MQIESKRKRQGGRGRGKAEILFFLKGKSESDGKSLVERSSSGHELLNRQMFHYSAETSFIKHRLYEFKNYKEL